MKQIFIALALVATPNVVAAQSQPDFCTKLNEIVASATETPSFASMTRGDAGTWVPRGMIGCTVSRYTTAGIDDGYACSGDAPTEVAAATALNDLHERIGQCLGVRGVTPDLMDLRGEGELVYRVSSRVTVFASRRGAGASHSVSFGVQVSK